MGTMQAIVLERENSFDSLKITSVPLPEPGPDEVLVQLKASALNRRDVWIVQGKYPGIKVPVILGSDGAGVIVGTGEGVEERVIGDEVIINPSLNWGEDMRAQGANYQILGMPRNGTQAQFIAVPYDNVFSKPAHLSFAQAAALPLGGLTGYRALFTQGGLMSGETVLITGAGGGVASLMIPMALACGANVIATSGDPKKLAGFANARFRGGVLYTDENWAAQVAGLAGPEGIDLIVDSAGGEGFNTYLDLINPGGRVVFFGATVGNPKGLNLRKIFWKQITLQGTTMGHEQDFDHMLQLIEKQNIVPRIEGPFAFADYRKAYQCMMDGSQTGKIVIEIE